LALARRRRPASSWDVLARWARPGLVAAAVVLVFLAAALRLVVSGGEAPTGPIALDEVLRYTGEDESVPTVLLTNREPDLDAVVAAALARDSGGAGRTDR
jgi:anti-sigma-K factor RskA